MRTKTLLLTAALGLAGALTLSAQIYSVNAVGYVNLTLPGGGLAYSLIANPLNGTNNHLNTILPLASGVGNDGTTVLRFNPVTQGYYDAIQFVDGFGWFTADPGGDATMTIDPGEGFWIQPTAPTLNVTFVGEVPQGHLVTPLPGQNKYAIVASKVPQAAPIGDDLVLNNGDLDFAADPDDTVLVFDNQTQGYKDAYQYVDGYGWYSANPDDPGPQGPTIPVGFGFWIQKSPAATKTQWVRDFSVN